MSKLGPHIIRSTPAALKWAKVARIVKSIDNPDALRGDLSATILVHRHYFADQSLQRPPVDVVHELIASLQGFRDPRLVVEVYNEINGNTTAYITFLKAVVLLLNTAGLKVAGPSWATGDYEAADWAAFRAARWAGLNYVSLHGYWAGAGLSPWNALRYRTFWKPGDRNIIITEAGRDIVRDGPNGTYIGAGGWKADKVSAETYLAEIEKYGAELEKDSYVLGSTIFSTGTTPDWAPYDCDELVDRLIQSTPSAMKEQLHVPTIGAGFQKCVQYLGQPTENEIYHAQGTDHETSLAIFANGYATYSKRLNQVVAVANDGTVWDDRGNHGDSSLQRVIGPFR